MTRRTKITEDMIQWAKDHGACAHDLSRCPVGMTLGKALTRRTLLQRFVLGGIQCDLGIKDWGLLLSWLDTEINSPAETRAFFRLLAEIELVDA